MVSMTVLFHTLLKGMVLVVATQVCYDSLEFDLPTLPNHILDSRALLSGPENHAPGLKAFPQQKAPATGHQLPLSQSAGRIRSTTQKSGYELSIR